MRIWEKTFAATVSRDACLMPYLSIYGVHRDFNFDSFTADLSALKAQREKDDDVAEHWEWREEELARREKYDRQAAASEKPLGTTPWNPEVDEEGNVKDTTRQKYKELWKM